MTQNSKFNQNTFLHSWITVFDPMYIAKLVRHIKYLILETQRTSSSKLRNFQCPVAWKLDHFGGRTTSFIHPSTVKHRIWAGPENIKKNKSELLGKTKKILFLNNKMNARNLHVMFVVFASRWFIFLYNEEFCCEVLSSIYRTLPKFLRMGNLYME